MLRYGDQLTDIGTDEADLAAFLATAREREAGADPDAPEPDLGEFEGEFAADPEPGFAGGGFEDRIFPDSAFDPPKGRGPSARLVKDIQAKTALFLLPLGAIWKARDEYCGGAFTESIPDVSGKLAAIFADSPDVVRWFTASGKWMKYLDLAMSLELVGTAIVRHHVTHRAHEDGPAAADWSAYAAG